MKPVRTLVVLANEREARFLENSGVGKGLTEISNRKAGEAPEYTDTPGRSRGAPGQARHGFQPSTSERRQARDSFAAEVLDAMRTEWEGGAFDRVLIAAPPKMLGELRAGLGNLSGQVMAEVPKDLVKLPPAELPSHFADVAAF